MDKLIELLQQIQDLAGTAVDALKGAAGGQHEQGRPGGGGPPHGQPMHAGAASGTGPPEGGENEPPQR